jgi:hypothetical protein
MKMILPAVLLTTVFSTPMFARCGCETAPCEEETVATAVQPAVQPAMQMDMSLVAINPAPAPIFPMFLFAVIVTLALIARRRFIRRTENRLLLHVIPSVSEGPARVGGAIVDVRYTRSPGSLTTLVMTER